MDKQKRLKQVKFTKETINAYRYLAIETGKTLEMLYNEAIEWFVKNRTSHELLSRLTHYYVCPQQGKYISMWLHPHNFDAISTIAHNDNVHHNRVIYTALNIFLDSSKEKKLALE